MNVKVLGGIGPFLLTALLAAGASCAKGSASTRGGGLGGATSGSGGEPLGTGGATTLSGGAGGTQPGTGGTTFSAGGATTSSGGTTTSSGGTGGNRDAGQTDASRDVGATGGNREAGATGGTVGTGGSGGTGGTSVQRGSGGTSGSGGSSGTGGASGKVFSQCRFHFGTIDSIAKTAGASMISQLDFFTPGWMMGTWNQSSVCTESASGGALAGLVPVDVTYIAANYVKNQNKLCDCNVTTCGSSGGKTNDLCTYGAQYITQDWAAILAAYTSNSTGFAGCLGGRPIIFEMEPDWYQYTISGQTQPWTAAQAGTNMTALVNALKSSLPNAFFSMDISPWIASNGSGWYPNFDMSLFTFINTSGGGTDAGNTKIRSNNAMTWAGVNQVTGKPILADTGYGAAGASAGEDPNWNVAANINARIADGVISISQYNPTSSWGSTISGIRGQLNQPRYCP